MTKRTTRQKIQVILFWMVIFLWLLYGGLMFYIIWRNEDNTRREYRERMDDAKDTRDDAFKNPGNVGARWDQMYHGQGGPDEMYAAGDQQFDLDQPPAERVGGPIAWIWGD